MQRAFDLFNIILTSRRLLPCSHRRDAWRETAMAMCCPDPSGYHHLLEFQGRCRGKVTLACEMIVARIFADSPWNRVPTTDVVPYRRTSYPISHHHVRITEYAVSAICDLSSSSPSPDKIGRFVNLITTQIPTAPPIVTLGISYDFVKWISDAKIEPV